MPNINSTTEYMFYMGRASQNALEFCLKKCHEDLQKAMQRDLYGAYSPTDYERTDAMLDAWRETAQQTQGSIMFFGGLLPKNPDKGQHTSIMGGASLNDMILDVLEDGYRGFNAHTGKQIPSRPFWDKWMQRADKMVGKWYAQGLRMQGLTVIG